MRKYNRAAYLNIAVKALLFVTFVALSFCVFYCFLNLGILISAAVAALFGSAVVFLFSYLLRYTAIYFKYYFLISGLLFRNSQGNVYCPCCGKRFEKFQDDRYYDDKRFNPSTFSNSRQDVICDCCRSAPRQRIIAEWAEQNTELLNKSEILYFAPELSMMLWFKRHGIKVKTADLFDRRTDLKLDLTALDLPDESVDIVFCNHVLEHVTDHSRALSELHRIIRKGGRLIISFPIDESLDEMIEDKECSVEDRIRLFGQCDHLRLFGKDSKMMLENAGFEADTIDIRKMPEDIVPVTGPSDYDTNKIFCCIRK